jgi:MFS family permease
MIAAFATTRVFFQGPMGALSDRYGRKPFVVFPLLGYALVSTLYLFATAPWHVIAIRAFQGFFSASLWPVSDAIVMDIVPPAHRGRAISTIQMAYTSGSLMGPFLGGVLADLLGLSYVFIITAALVAVGFLFSVVFLKETHPRKVDEADSLQAHPRFPMPFSDTGRVLRKFPALRRLALTGLLIQMSPALTSVFIPIFIVNVLSGGEADVGIILGLVGLLSMIGQWLSGQLGDRYGKWRVILYSLIAATMLAPLLLTVRTLTMLYVLLPICMVATSLGMPMVSALVGDALPLGERGTGYGTYGLVRDISLILAPTVSGVTLEILQSSYGLSLAAGIPVLFLMSTIILASAAITTVMSVKDFQVIDSVVWMRTKVPPTGAPE